MSKSVRKNYKKGAVSLYVVIFTALLLSVITVSFIRIMLGEQRNASNTDLSQSAYDSAMAGVEDAKVALLKYQDCTSKGGASGSDSACEKVVNALKDNANGDDCDVVAKALGIGVPGEETIIQTGQGDSSADLQQAYTCVKITSQTDDFLGNLNPGQSKLVPLRFTGNIDRVRISWHMVSKSGAAQNLPNTTATDKVNLFPGASSWPNGRPSVLRTHLMQTASEFNLSQFDEFNASAINRGTLFLYPTAASVNNTIPSSELIHSSSKGQSGGVNSPTPIKCSTSDNEVYACVATIMLPEPIGGARNKATSFLRLTGYYGGVTDFKVEGLNGSNVVKFDGVQPMVDSTGRANDLFRRVASRIELIDVFYPFPEFTVELDDNADSVLCKNIVVTDEEGWAGEGCTKD